MLKVAGYIRVSAASQTEGLSLDAQRDKIAAYCKLHDLKLLEILEDAGVSAKTVVRRPAAQKLLSLVQTKEVSGIVVVKLDRLARNTRDALEIADLCRRKGAALHSIVERLDTSSSMGKFFFTICAAFAELERGQIAERTQMALQHKKSQGQKTGGTVPFGFRVIRRRHEGKVVKCLLPKWSEQQVIAWMRTVVRKRRTSLRNLAGRLNERGIPTKTRKGRWSAEAVRKILKRAA